MSPGSGGEESLWLRPVTTASVDPKFLHDILIDQEDSHGLAWFFGFRVCQLFVCTYRSSRAGAAQQFR